MQNKRQGCSARIQMLLDLFYEDYEAHRHLDQRGNIYRGVFQKNRDKSEARKTALGFEAFLDQKDIFINEYDLLAGHVEFYDYTDTLPINQKQLDAYFGMTDTFLFDVQKEIGNYKRSTGIADDSKEAGTLSWFLNARDCRLITRWGSGHFIPGYEKILLYGWDAVIEEGETVLAHTQEPQKRECIENMLITDRAVQRYILRYAALAEEEAGKTKNPLYEKTLARIAAGCEHVAHHPARSFFEAVQLLFLTHDAIICESLSGSVSLGRLDQMLYPYYRKDLEEGRITPHEAQELIEALWLKFARLMAGYQNVTLGGADEYGVFAGNELTLMCLRASRDLLMDQPLVSFRYHGEMPKVFWEEIIALIRTGTGFPAMFNDEAIYRAKLDAGVQLEDVWNYGIIGCVEPSIGGKEFSKTEEMRVSWAKLVELMLFQGECGVTGTRVKLLEEHDLDSFTDFHDFYEWYKRELVELVKLAAEGTFLLDDTYGKFWPLPFLSSTYGGAFAKGTDVADGGAEYNFTSINSVGMADAVDSLEAIRELVFRKKILKLSELAKILRGDFEGQELLRKQILNLPHRFGNDDSESDEMMAELTALVTGLVRSLKDHRGNNCQAGLYSVYYHAVMGGYTSALPNGRKAKTSLANGFSPCQGSDDSGPTACMNSVLKSDHSVLGNGMVLDMKFTPQFLESKGHQQGLIDLLEDYFCRGGMEMQFNVVKRETLLAAQEHPEEYRNLIVRVSGYSAYFVTLGKTLQDEIIARTEIA